MPGTTTSIPKTAEPLTFSGVSRRCMILPM